MGLHGVKKDYRFVGSLTGLRYVAAVTVAVGHGAPALRHDWLAQLVAQISSIGMTLFFVLSGFVLWLNYAESFAVKPSALVDSGIAMARNRGATRRGRVLFGNPRRHESLWPCTISRFAPDFCIRS
jgi:Acyltransferase family